MGNALEVVLIMRTNKHGIVMYRMHMLCSVGECRSFGVQLVLEQVKQAGLFHTTTVVGDIYQRSGGNNQCNIIRYNIVKVVVTL